MMAHLKIASEHQKLANAIATKLETLLDPVQGLAPSRGKKKLSDEQVAKIVAGRMRTIANYKIVHR